MTITRFSRAGALLFGAAIVAAACGPSGSSSTPTNAATQAASQAATQAAISGNVAVDGSSTVFPIAERIAEDFQTANAGVKVAVAESGTGGGFKKFCVGETDMNDASRPIKADDAGEGKACKTNSIDYVELTIALDGITVVVNSDNDFVTCLTVGELKKIYGPDSPQNLKWSDVNPAFPAEAVERFMPGADSGTFDFFTEAINGETDSASTFPTQSEDDNVLVTGVAGDAHAIGFFGFAYYVQNKDKLKAVQVDAGSGCVEPTDATINDGSYKPLSRPLFIYPDTGKAKTRPELKAFVDYFLANVKTVAAEVGYVALPDDKLAAEVTEWTAAVGG